MGKFKKKQIATLLYGNNEHYLDHLAPLSHFLNVPLVLNEKNIFELSKKYYPEVNSIYLDNLNIHSYIVNNYDYIITCITKDLFDNDFKIAQDISNKDTQIIWVPHGASDKGQKCFFFESLKNAFFALIYGEKMREVLKEKKVFKTIRNIVEIGNYRLEYFKKFYSFYQNIVQEEILKKFQNNNLTILYVPTWQDFEKSSSFNKYFKMLLKNLPKNFNLIIKLHPNLLKQYEIDILIQKEKNENKNILFLDNFPIIYPLLNIIDIYLGDFSSIGYDFLYFDKPMFFLKSENNNFSNLFECGHLITKNIYKTIEQNLDHKSYSSQKDSLYKYTFSKTNLISFKQEFNKKIDSSKFTKQSKN